MCLYRPGNCGPSRSIHSLSSSQRSADPRCKNTNASGLLSYVNKCGCSCNASQHTQVTQLCTSDRYPYEYVVASHPGAITCKSRKDPELVKAFCMSCLDVTTVKATSTYFGKNTNGSETSSTRHASSSGLSCCHFHLFRSVPLLTRC